jgi:hypothetical protein
VKFFLSNIEKRLIDLALPKIIMDYDVRAILVEAFAIVEQCDRILCQHDTTDLVSMLVEETIYLNIWGRIVGVWIHLELPRD